MGIALPLPLHSARLHGAATWPPVSGSQPYCHSGEGRGMGAVSKMHGMRWKVNSDMETQEGRKEGGWVIGSRDCFVFLNEILHQGSGTALSPLQLCLALDLTNA